MMPPEKMMAENDLVASITPSPTATSPTSDAMVASVTPPDLELFRTPEKIRAPSPSVESFSPDELFPTPEKLRAPGDPVEMEESWSYLEEAGVVKEPWSYERRGTMDSVFSEGSSNDSSRSIFYSSNVDCEFKLRDEEAFKAVIDLAVDNDSERTTIDTGVALVALRVVWNWETQKLIEDFEQQQPFEGEEDLGSESSVDLGEGSLDRKYFDPDCQDHLLGDPEYRLTLYVDILKLKKPEADINIDEIRKTLSLPLDEIPEELRRVKLDMRPCRSPDEENLYRQVVIRSGGYEAPGFREKRSPVCCSLRPLVYNKVHGSRSEEFEGYCKQAIEEYNQKKGTFYEFKYLIKVVSNNLEEFITFALTDGKYKPYVGRLCTVFNFDSFISEIFEELRITKGEYRVPRWQGASGEEYKCVVNEEYREKLPELEEKWKQKMGLKN